MTDETDSFAEAEAEAEARENRLFEQLAKAPIVEVWGVVEPGGIGGYSRSDGLWTFSFTFHAWRIKGGGVQTRRLRVSQKTSQKKFRKAIVRISGYTVLRIKARVVVDSLSGSPEARLELIVGTNHSDVELDEIADGLPGPVVFHEAVIGTFTLDRYVSGLTAITKWDGQEISLELSAIEAADVQQALKIAHALWQDQFAWNRRIRDYAEQDLLPLKNEGWLEEGEDPVSADDFHKRMRLRSITIDPDGSFDFMYDDGDMFWGHGIEVLGNLSDGPAEANLFG